MKTILRHGSTVVATLMAASLFLFSCQSQTSSDPQASKVQTSEAQTSKVRWEQYASKHCTFTVLKPAGWTIEERYQDSPRMWSFTATDPTGLYQVTSFHGVSPTGYNNDVLIRAVVADMFKQAPSLELAPTARLRRVDLTDEQGRKTGQKTILVFEGSYTSPQNHKRQFRNLITVGNGLVLNQRIEADAGRLGEAAPVLLQILANVRVAKGIYTFDEGGKMAQSVQPNRPAQLHPTQLASGWVKLSIPQGWQTMDLGKGACMVTDPGKRLYFLAATAEFVTPRYCVRGVPGVLCSEIRSPSDAFAFSAAQGNRAHNFQFSFVKERPDLIQQMRAASGPLRAQAVEDFAYTCTVNGRLYRGFTTGGCSSDAMRASWRLWHFTIMAPSEEFEQALPTLAAIMGSYQLNQEMAGQYMANNLRNYYAGLRNLSNQIAQNSEQMRRENLELFMEKGRVQDYVSYQTTRMIMGDYDYLAGASGYVRGDPSGLYTSGGTRIVSEPYGESITRNMQEINTRELYERVRP
jgi:hypothetical protein